MRTTLTIDDDVLGVARTLAHESNRSVGKVISALARRGLNVRMYRVDDLGLPVFQVSEDASVFGPEEVAEGEDEL